MTSAREEATPTGSVGPGERSVVRTIRGLHWWATLALAATLTVAGIAVDLLAAGELGVVFTVCLAGGCLLATAWARRDELFVPMVQPPLILVVAVPLVVVATGSLPSSGGTVSLLLAIGGPLISAFPTLAITTAACLALGFVRTRLEAYQRPDADDVDLPPRPRPPKRRPDDERDPRDRDPRDRAPRDRPARDRDPRDRDPRDRPPRDRDRPSRDRDPRDRDRPSRDRDPRDPRDRDPRDRDPRDRPRRLAGGRRTSRDLDDAVSDDSHWDGRRDDPREGAPRRRPPRPETGRGDPRADPRDDFGPGVRRVPRRVDGPPDDRRPQR